MADEAKEARKRPRFTGRAKGPDRELVLGNSQQGEAGSGPQKRAARSDAWSAESRKIFLETLALTCNVSEAARVVGRNLSTVYYQKRRDPAFARAWKQALSIGHEELKALMLRQALFGTEEEEIVLDAEGAVKSRKIKRGHPHMVQAILFKAHQQEVAEMLEQEEVEKPDGEDAVMRLRKALELVRERRGG
ncbi:hypothetical protein Sphch_0196 [Sphingobium chlorophenolicum L-1]|uniref:Terminase small subunit n=1 Tax=Sphingobium chlorophenolicum L-1 TaxID=690566 RepID=F6EUK2_SPHCR|nr:hypothetical protein [Sphingobium chlorophenolicum]AEG47896.1 hypothetical protein Sphch_0196 [Sphingobium chlorophenolicum L-1]